MDVRLKSQYQLRQVEPEPSNVDEPSNSAEPEPMPKTHRIDSSIRWVQLRKLGAILYPTSSPFGRPTTFLCGSKFLAVGTFSADILLFDYDQSLIAQLSPQQAADSTGEMFGPITTLAFSQDESHIVAGFGLGAVCLFDLEAPPSVKPKLLTLVRPLAPNTVRNSRFQHQESHMRGIPVITCAFVPGRRKTFISIDASGVVVVHRYHRIILEYSTKSRRILGSYDVPTPILSASIYGNIVALLTPELLEVVLLDVDNASNPFSELLRIPRSRDTDENPHGKGIVSFCNTGEFTSGRDNPAKRNPAKRNLAGDVAKLIYAWGKEMKVMSIDLRLPSSQCASVLCGYTSDGPIEQLDWLLPDLIVVLSRQPVCKIDFVKLSDSCVIDSELLSPSRNLVKLNVSGYSLFALGKHEFSIGRLTNWADRLLMFVNNGEPASAVKLAMHYYENDGDLSVFGLPRNDQARKSAIKQALPDLMLTAIKFSAQYDHESLKTLLPEAIKASATAKISILEQILEIVDNEQWSRKLFMDTLLSLVIDHKLSSLPPAVFKELVISNADPHLIYNLDISTLDLDLAFKLCAKYPEKLSEVRIYIENMALHDYTSPLHDHAHVFDYLALLLTSRIYPTGEEMKEERATESKLQIFEALFLKDPEYGLLHELLDINRSSFYTALNEAFEDPWLNENTEINRQTIVNLLLGLDTGEAKFDIQFCIFVARNYPKYRQYLVLPETVLHEIVDRLCDLNSTDVDPEEAQLAILSLLSRYEPRDTSSFIEKLVNARYMLVLQQLFRKRNQLLELAELKLKLSDKTDFWQILNECVYKNRSKSIIFITQHFHELGTIDLAELSRLVVRHGIAEVWSESIYSSFDDALKKDLFDLLFDEIYRKGGKLPPMEVRIQYIELLSKDNKSDNRLMHVLKNILTGPLDVELPLVVDTLIAHDKIDALAVLLCRRDRKSEAMIYLLNFIPELVDKALDQNDIKTQADVDSYVQIACQVSLEVASASKEEGNRLCQRLVETLVVCGLTSQLSEVVAAMISSNHVDVSQVATYLLSETSASKSKLPAKATPQIVSQIYSDLVRQERGLRCFFEVALNDGYHELLAVLDGRAKGWAVPVDGECEVCGRKIIGLGIDAEKLYAYWWSKMNGGARITDELDKESLILFQCGHSYHNGCLQKMTSQRQCVICLSQQ